MWVDHESAMKPDLEGVTVAFLFFAHANSVIRQHLYSVIYVGIRIHYNPASHCLIKLQIVLYVN